MAGLCAPLSTLRQYPHGYLRMTRGRCGSLLLHRDGLAPSTPCRSPGALRSTPITRQSRSGSALRKSTSVSHLSRREGGVVRRTKRVRNSIFALVARTQEPYSVLSAQETTLSTPRKCRVGHDEAPA